MAQAERHGVMLHARRCGRRSCPRCPLHSHRRSARLCRPVVLDRCQRRKQTLMRHLHLGPLRFQRVVNTCHSLPILALVGRDALPEQTLVELPNPIDGDGVLDGEVALVVHSEQSGTVASDRPASAQGPPVGVACLPQPVLRPTCPNIRPGPVVIALRRFHGGDEVVDRRLRVAEEH